MFGMNQPVFIQSGFKNSIIAGFVALLMAMAFSTAADVPATRKWWICGALVALAILLRETLLYFTVIGAIAVLVSAGWRHCLRFVGGGLIAGVVILGIGILLRGGLDSLLAGYNELGIHLANLADKRWAYFLTHGSDAVKEFKPLIVFGALGFATILAVWVDRAIPRHFGRYGFWLAVAVVPLMEPALKVAMPYHFSVCLFGLAGMTALGWKTTASLPGEARLGLALCGVALFIPSTIPKIDRLLNGFPQTVANLAAFDKRAWPQRSIESSHYLMTAKAIGQFATPDSSLSVSGASYVLFPLTGLRPRSNPLANLSDYLGMANGSSAALERGIRSCPPDIVVTVAGPDQPGSEIVARVIQNMPEYEKVATVPFTPSLHYGFLASAIYRRISPDPGCNPPVAGSTMF